MQVSHLETFLQVQSDGRASSGEAALGAENDSAPYLPCTAPGCLSSFPGKRRKYRAAGPNSNSTPFDGELTRRAGEPRENSKVIEMAHFDRLTRCDGQMLRSYRAINYTCTSAPSGKEQMQLGMPRTTATAATCTVESDVSTLIFKCRLYTGMPVGTSILSACRYCVMKSES
jgi:hypothetical protein